MTNQAAHTDAYIAHARDVAHRTEAFFERLSRLPRPAWLSPLAEVDHDCPKLAATISHAHDVAKRTDHFFGGLVSAQAMPTA